MVARTAKPFHYAGQSAVMAIHEDATYHFRKACEYQKQGKTDVYDYTVGIHAALDDAFDIARRYSVQWCENAFASLRDLYASEGSHNGNGRARGYEIALVWISGQEQPAG